MKAAGGFRLKKKKHGKKIKKNKEKQNEQTQERTRSGGQFGIVVKRLKPLRDGGAGELQVRIIENHGVRRLDIRYFVKSEKYTGYTRKGISLAAEEYEVLRSQDKKIRRFLRG
jgi:hypothetical protein